MKIIAVTGGSGCGKTFFTKLLIGRLSKSKVLPLDSYYFDKPEQIPIGEYDFDVPNAFDFKLFRFHLESLLSGNPAQKPNFCYDSGKRLANFTLLYPEEYLIIEGLHVLLYPDIRDKVSFSFYLESPLDVAVSRRCLRDIKEHSMTAKHSINQYLKFVRPVFFEFIQPTKKFANLVVENKLDSRLDLFLDDYLAKNSL